MITQSNAKGEYRTMCVMSMIMDHHYDRWNPRRIPGTAIAPNQWVPIPPLVPQISPEEIAEFYELLERARVYDKEHGQPDCELKSKKEKLKELAKELGVEITFS